MLEIYQAYADYEDMMALTEELISRVVLKVNGSMRVEFEGQVIDFSTPWKRVQMLEAIKEHTGLDFNTITDDESARQSARALGLEIDDQASRGEVINEVFGSAGGRASHSTHLVYGHPVEISPLAKRNREHPELTDRFEVFIMQREIANAFSELNDPIDQKQRFVRQAAKRAGGDAEAHMMDED